MPIIPDQLQDKMPYRVKIGEALGVSWGATVGALTLEHWTRVGALICMGLSAVASIYVIQRQKESAKRERIKVVRDERQLCDECMRALRSALNPIPEECPIPEDERPRNCPLRVPIQAPRPDLTDPG